MQNKPVLLFLGTLFLLCLLGEALYLSRLAPENNTLDIAIGILGIMGLAMILWDGTLKKATLFFSLIILFLVITLVGAAFKIMNWPYGGIMLLIGMTGVPVIYIFRFYSKPVKKHLDVLKLLWVISFYLFSMFKIMHWPGAGVFNIVETLVFLLMFFDYLYLLMRSNQEA